MDRSLWISASGMEAQQLRTANIANNMSNVNTTSYKKGDVHFEDMLYERLQAPGAQSSTSNLPAGQQLGTGVRVATASKVFSQGTLQATSADLDLAIEGSGFFQVQLSDGSTAYTRDGHFHMNSSGQVQDNHGNTVIGFPTLDPEASSITVNSDGTVSVFVNGANTSVGRIQMALVPNPEGMNYLGRNLYTETEASGSASVGNPGSNNYGQIAQHYLENSNVEIVKEMVNLIAAQRAYDLNAKSIKAADEMLRQIANLK